MVIRQDLRLAVWQLQWRSLLHPPTEGIRLNEGINEALRTLIRYRGDLSTMALEALDSVDLTRAALVSAEERMVRDTTITMPRLLHKKLKKIADDRNSSMNILVNYVLFFFTSGALAHWLAKKGALRLR